MRRVVTAAIVASLVLPMAVTSTATAEDPPPTSGTITGVVVDGLDVAIDATVILQDAGQVLPEIQVDTAADGSFTFADVPLGDYRLRAEADGYGRLWWPGARSTYSAGTVTVSTEVPTVQRDLVFGPGRITGAVVTPTADGPVALPDWKVTAWSTSHYDSAEGIDVPPASTSDVNGQFEIGGLEDDTWVVQLTSPDGITSWYGGTEFANAEQFEISSSGGVTQHDIVVEISTGGVQGTVTINGVPLETGWAQVRAGTTTVASASIAIGSYSVSYLADGTYWLDVRWNADDEMSQLQYGSASATPFVVTNGVVTTFDVDMTTVALTGTVTYDAATTTLHQVRAEKRVYVEDEMGGWWETTERYGTVAADGTFTIDGLDPGEWHVVVPFQHGQWWFGSSTGQQNDATPVTIAIVDDGTGPVTSFTVDGVPINGLDIVVPTGSIYGTIELPSWSSAAIRIQGVDNGFQRNLNVWNDNEGSSTLNWTAPVIPDGQYLVTANDWQSGITFEHTGPVSVELGASVGPIDLAPPAGRISGTLTWDPATVNVWSITAESVPTAGDYETNTRSVSIGADGQFELTGLASGEWRVRADFQGDQWWFGSPSGRQSDATIVTVAITDGGDGPVSTMSVGSEPLASVDIALPTGAITGTIILPDDADDPYGMESGATIEVMGVGNDVTRWHNTSGGSWAVGALPDGDYRIQVNFWSGGSFEHPDTVSVVDGQTTGSIVLTPPTGRISGTLELPDGLGPWGDSPTITAETLDGSVVRTLWLWDAVPHGITNWEIGTLPDGEYTVRASVEGIGQTTHPGTITITDGLASSTVDLVVAMPDGAITGVVTSGGVTLEGATVRAEPESGDWFNSRSATTDAAGGFTIAGLAEGSYRISIQTDDGQWWFGSTRGDFWDATRIMLTTSDDGAGQIVSTMMIAGQIVASLAVEVPAGSIHGTLTVPDGFQFDWASVSVTDLPNEVLSRNTGINGPGAWSLGMLPDGTYRVRVDIDGVGTITHPTPVVVSGGQADAPVDITIAGGRIDGGVTRSGSPVPWTQVIAVNTGATSGAWDGNSYYAQADGQGRFSLRGLPDGDYHVRVNTWSYEWWHGTTGQLDGAFTVTVVSGQVPDIEIALPDLTITGTLTFRGQPLPYREIRLEGDSVWETTYTEGDGSFKFTALPPGQYTLTAWSDSGVLAVYPTPEGSSEVRFALSLDLPVVDIDFIVPQGSLVGTILRGGVPMGPPPIMDNAHGYHGSSGPARVIATRYAVGFSPYASSSAVIASDGTFRIDGLLPGAYLIQVIDEFGNLTMVGITDPTALDTFTIGPDELDVNTGVIDLPAAGALTGVVDTGSTPVADARVFARNEQSGRMLESRTAADGSYSFPNLSPGEYLVEVAMEGNYYESYYAPGVLDSALAGTYTVTSLGSTTANVSIPRRTSISGTITATNGVGLGSVQVTGYVVLPDQPYGPPRAVASTTTSFDGSYTLAGLPEGVPLSLSFWTSGGEADRPTVYWGPSARLETATTFVLSASTPSDPFDIVMGPAGSISGVVRDSSGARMVAEVRLVPVSDDGTVNEFSAVAATSTANGDYRFDDLPSAKYTVRATAISEQYAGVAVGWLGGALTADSAGVITLDHGEHRSAQVVEIPNGASISGVVRVDGVGVAGVEVGVRQAGNSGFWRFRTAVTGDDGSYTIRGVPAMNDIVVEAMPPTGSRYLPVASVPFSVVSSDLVGKDITLPVGVFGTATVLGLSGEVVPSSSSGYAMGYVGVSTCRDPDVFQTEFGGCPTSAYIGARPHPDGERWLVGPLDPDTFNIRSRSSFPVVGEVPGPAASITLAAGDTFDCTLHLANSGGTSSCSVTPIEPAGTLSGRLVASDGNGVISGVSGMTVSLVGDDLDSVYFATVSDANGDYSFTDLPAGDYRVRTWSPGSRPVFAPAMWSSPDGVGSWQPVRSVSAATPITIGTGSVTVAGVDLPVAGAAYGTAIVQQSSGTYAHNPVICPGTLTNATWPSSWECPDGSEPSWVEWRPDSYRIGPLLPGTYTIRSWAWFGNDAGPTATFTVTEGDRINCTLSANPLGASACSVTFVDFVPPVSGTEPSPDPEQSNSVTLVDPSITVDDPESTNLVTVSASSSTDEDQTKTLTNVTLIDEIETGPLPETEPEAKPQSSLISFDVVDLSTENGVAETIVVTVLLSAPANRYYKFSRPHPDAEVQWWNATHLVRFLPSVMIDGKERWPVEITLTDGQQGDADWLVNGIISDPGRFFLTAVPDPDPEPEVTCIDGQTVLLNDADASITVLVDDADVAVEVSVKVDASELGSGSGTYLDISCDYDVTVDFLGFERPISDGELNRANAGRTIPVKFRIVDANGVGVGDPVAVKALTNTVADCVGEETNDELVPDTVGSGLTHLGDGNWQFNWKTNRGWSGTCRNLRIGLAGAPALHAVIFDFR